MLVMTIDQRGSRHREDLVDDLIDMLHKSAAAERLVRSFERTAGDEVQAIVGSAEDAVDIALTLVRTGEWTVGIGAGPVRMPIPESVRAANGPAFIYARDAVDRAKKSPYHVAVAGPDSESASEAEDLLRLLGAVVQRRSREGWEVADLMADGLSQKEIARQLGITPQAVSQRLRTGLWREERRVRPLAARLLAQADS